MRQLLTFASEQTIDSRMGQLFSLIDNNATLQKYPEATLTGFRQPLFDSPLQIDFTAAYGHGWLI